MLQKAGSDDFRRSFNFEGAEGGDRVGHPAGYARSVHAGEGATLWSYTRVGGLLPESRGVGNLDGRHV